MGMGYHRFAPRIHADCRYRQRVAKLRNQMESSTSTYQGPTAVHGEPDDVPEHGAASRAKQRGAVLAKMLFMGDSFAAFCAAGVAVIALGLQSWEGLVFVLAATALWPLAAFSIGLYRSDQLSTWASAVTEIPRGVVAVLLITWPLFGVADALGVSSEVMLTFLTVAGIGGFTGIARAVVRAGLHRAPDLRQRTLIIGSGVVAGQVVTKLNNNLQFGLVPVGMIDDDVHHVGSPDLPWLGRFDDLSDVIRDQQIDRVIIAFSRASHEQLLEAIRACRDAGVAVDVVPRLFEFLDGVRALDQVGGLPLLSIGAPVLTSASMAAKRVFDVVGIGLLITIFSPLMLRDRDRDQARVPRARLLPPAPRRPRQHQLPGDQVPLDVHGRRGAQEGGRPRSTKPPTASCSRSAATRASPASGASSAAPHWTSCRSSSTSSAAR